MPDTARAVLAAMTPGDEPLLDALQRELHRRTGVLVPREDAWDLVQAAAAPAGHGPGDGRGARAGRGQGRRPQPQRELRPRLRAVLSRAAAGLTRTGLTSWDLDTLPTVFREGTIVAYPALADAGATVDVRLFETEDAARSAMWSGTRRLILLGAPSPVKSIAGRLSTPAKLALSHNPHGSVAAMFADCVNCAADYLMAELAARPGTARASSGCPPRSGPACTR